jgi:C4-type Zn-finger protein
MSGILQVLYTCHGCGLKDAPVTVAHRKQGEDIALWVEKVAQWVANDHLARSPKCTARKCDLKIPLPAEEGIGYAAKEAPGP